MLIHRLRAPLGWPAAELPLAAIEHDWHGAAITPPPRWAVAVDDEHLWLVAARDAPPRPAPHAVPGAFTPELWRHDVAELFLGREDDDAYVEINVAPNGAWWACVFSGPRVSRATSIATLPGVRTHADPRPDGWRAAIGLPTAPLLALIGARRPEAGNVTFVLADSPARYATATAAVPGAPDFHAPALRRRFDGGAP